MLGDSWVHSNWQPGSGSPLDHGVVHLGRRPAHCPRRGTGKSLWSRMGGAKKIMPCGARERFSDWTMAPRETPIFEGYLLWLAKLATPDSSFARSQSCHSLSRCTPAARASYSGEEARGYDYGNGVVYVRSDKDTEPETNGEGIKKEIQYRRTPCLSEQLFRLERCDGASFKRLKHPAAEANFDSARKRWIRHSWATGRFFRWRVCRLGYSEGAAMAVGSQRLHIGIWTGAACARNWQERTAFWPDPHLIQPL